MQASNHITAVILAGGKGTRLRSMVADRQKVVAEINGKPFLALLLRQLEKAGIRKVIICTGYMAETVKQALANSSGSLELCFSHETEPLGTGGAVRLALEQISTPRVLLLNGDSYIDTELNGFINNQGMAHMMLVEVPDVSRFGRVILDACSRIITFSEKGEYSGRGLINGGVYLFDKKLLYEYMPEISRVSLEREIFPRMVTNKLITGETINSRFIDIGLPESLQAAQKML